MLKALFSFGKLVAVIPRVGLSTKCSPDVVKNGLFFYYIGINSVINILHYNQLQMAS